MWAYSIVILSWKFLFRLYGEQGKKPLIVSRWLEVSIVLRDFVLGSLFMTLIELKIIKKKNKTVFQTISNVVKKRKGGAESLLQISKQ